MIDFVISPTGKLSVYRVCPICDAMLSSDSNLRDDNKLRQKQRKDGSWYHTSKWGRTLHKWTSKKQEI